MGVGSAGSIPTRADFFNNIVIVAILFSFSSTVTVQNLLAIKLKLTHMPDTCTLLTKLSLKVTDRPTCIRPMQFAKDHDSPDFIVMPINAPFCCSKACHIDTIIMA